MFLKNISEKFGSLFSFENTEELINESTHLLHSKQIIEEIRTFENNNDISNLNLKKQELINTYAKHLIEKNNLDKNYKGKIILNIDYFSDYKKHSKYKEQLKENIKQNEKTGMSHGAKMQEVQEKTLEALGIEGKIFNFEVVNNIYNDSIRTVDSPFITTPIKEFSSKDKFGKPQLDYPMDVTELSLVLKELLPNAEINLNLSISNILMKEKQIIRKMMEKTNIDSNVYDLKTFEEKGFNQEKIDDLIKEAKNGVIIDNIKKVFDIAKKGIKVNMSGGNNAVVMQHKELYNNVLEIQKEKYSNIIKIDELLLSLTDKELKTIFYSSFINDEKDLEVHTSEGFDDDNIKRKMILEIKNQYLYFKEQHNKNRYEIHKNRHYVTLYYNSLKEDEKKIIKKNFSIFESVDFYGAISDYNEKGEVVERFNGLQYNLKEIKTLKNEKPKAFAEIDVIKNKIENLLINDTKSVSFNKTIEFNNLLKEIQNVKEKHNIKSRLFFSDYNFPFDFENNDLIKQGIYLDNDYIGETSEITAYHSRSLN